MNNEEQSILPHLKRSIPKDVYTFQISSYTIALEGWRRGLALKFISNRRGNPAPSTAIGFSLEDENNKYKFECARGSLVTKEAISTCIDKAKTYEALRKFGVPTPEGKTFTNESTIEEICKYGESIGFPLVVKATNLGGGKGVFANLTSRNELEEAVVKVREELNKKTVIVEKFFTGVDYRFHVVGDKVSGAVKYYPSNVIGDGVQTIKQLIDLRNKELKNNIVFYTKHIKIDDDIISFLAENGLSLDSVPQNNERIFLRRQGTHVHLRIPADVTDDLSDQLKENAIKAIKAIDGLYHGSVDMIVNEETGEGVVNEVNSRGEISMHIFPVEGKARDIPKDIVDFYFPNSSQRNEKFYFDFKPIKEMIVAGFADEIKVPPIPYTHDRMIFQKSITLKGHYLGPIYMNWLRREAAQLNIIGTMKKDKKTGEIVIKVKGSKFKINKFEKVIHEKGTKLSKVKSFKSGDFSRIKVPTNISMDIIKD